MSIRHSPNPSIAASPCTPYKNDELETQTSFIELRRRGSLVLPVVSRRPHRTLGDHGADHVPSRECAHPAHSNKGSFRKKVMRRTLQLAAVLLSIAVPGVCAQLQLKHEKPQVEDLSWMWQYTQPNSASQKNKLILDTRFRPFLENHFKAPQSFWGKNKPLSDVVMEFLDVPGQVIGDDNRYLNADGCVPDFCPDRGLLWIDLGLPHPLVAFAAIHWISDNRTTDQDGATYTMWLFSNITRVFFVDPDGTPHPVTPSTIGAHNELPAETTTEPDSNLSTTPKAQS
jgi:hypothetical protein